MAMGFIKQSVDVLCSVGFDHDVDDVYDQRSVSSSVVTSSFF